MKLILLVALAMVATTAAFGIGASATFQVAPQGTLVSARIATPVACKSSYFTANGSDDVVKANEKTVPPGRGLALYSDWTRRMQPIAAPNGWSCRVIVYGDGSVLLVASAHPTTFKPSLNNLIHVPAPMVAAYDSSVCSSCTFEAACGAIAFVSTMRGYGTCPQPKSDRQRTWTISVIPGETKVGFSDPPGTRGIGWPSGGKDPVSGVVVYRNSGPPSASIETCELPANGADVCKAINAYFASVSWPA